ncbi:MAG: acyl-ACP thioesterase domain-containing protein [Rikenellaceae bacterium]
MKPTTYTITIEQQDVDLTFRTSIATLICKVLNTAGLDAESKGFGVGELNKENYTWVLSRFAIEVDYLPRAFETIYVTTWIGDYRRLISTRNFTISNSEGRVIGGAVSQWCMLDLSTRKAIDLTKLHKNYEDYILSDIPSPIAPPHKISAVDDTTVSHSHKAVYSDIDFNRHVNAIRYIDLMLDRVAMDRLESEQPLRVDLQYINECYFGDTLNVEYEQRDNSALFEIRRNNECSAVKCAIEWRESKI